MAGMARLHLSIYVIVFCLCGNVYTLLLYFFDSELMCQCRLYGSVNLLFQTSSEDSSFLLLPAQQRIRRFAFMRYINP